ncbi:unnamed protein product [marine sediment metagenome]|uniref:Uncharacterized protein n=1 Tax=marine sediment metagenome TaxID=412755 RepID=X1QTE8_9ZZZZ
MTPRATRHAKGCKSPWPYQSYGLGVEVSLRAILSANRAAQIDRAIRPHEGARKARAGALSYFKPADPKNRM